MESGSGNITIENTGHGSAWVSEVLNHFSNSYCKDGELIISYRSNGEVLRNVPLVADLGDVLPFLCFFGMTDYSLEQLNKAKHHLYKGLYKRDGKVRLFLNHDWLLGLVELYRLLKLPLLLSMIEEAIDTLSSEFVVNNFLIDEKPDGINQNSLLAPASPFNGGFIELWLESADFTNDHQKIAKAEELASAWIQSRFFKSNSLFSHLFSAKYSIADRSIHSFSKLKARLFKDNTNLVWGVLEVYLSTRRDKWKKAIEKWLSGYEKWLWNNGAVYLYLSKGGKAHGVDLKAAFSSLDLLCDIHQAGIQVDQCKRLAEGIAQFWLGKQWPIGLFPSKINSRKDHLDANTDMIVALAKLYAITGNLKYWQSGQTCKQAILKYHHTLFGYCMAVNEEGNMVDDTILVKYQSLLLKLDLLKEEPFNVYQQEQIFELLKDR